MTSPVTSQHRYYIAFQAIPIVYLHDIFRKGTTSNQFFPQRGDSIKKRPRYPAH